MRITCPDCGAQYEVQDALIPLEGRDVQCSACSATWFQSGRPVLAPETFAAGRADTGTGEIVAPDPEAPPSFAQAREREPAVAGAQAPEAAPAGTAVASPPFHDTMETATRVVEANDPANEPGDGDAPANGEAAARGRGLDPSVRDILRSEAEREARLRQAETSLVESQAEMPLEAGPGTAPRRPALASADEPASALASRRRDLLPDIEEITSTLRARPPHGDDPEEAAPLPPSAEAVRRRGVRIGFFSTLILAALAVWIYANASLVAESVPQAAPALDAFTGQVDAARLWLDALALQLAEGGGS